MTGLNAVRTGPRRPRGSAASYGAWPLGNVTLPSINVWVDDPVLATVASQAGDWKLGEGEFATIGSGPARVRGI